MKFGSLARFGALLMSTTLISAPALSQEGQRPPAVSFPAVSSPVASPLKAAPTQSHVQDIAFSSSGQLVLTVLQPSGLPSIGQTVSVAFNSATVARVKTNSRGQVVISGLRPGVHVVETGLSQTVVRFWQSHTAPPQAVKQPAIVDATELVRGQYGYGYGAPMAPGLLAATVTAIGIGAVVVGKNSSSGNSSSTVDPASP